MDRAEHLQWAKDRALAYLPADPKNAMFSMMSDISKHEKLQGHPGLLISPIFYGGSNDPVEVRKWVEGLK